MKIGSLVECINSSNWVSDISTLESLGYKLPIRGKFYIIRELFTNIESINYLLLEEIVNPKVYVFGGRYLEAGWKTERFRELLPPIEINLEEIILQEI